MLVDLVWKNPDPERYIKFDTTDGHCLITFKHGEEQFDHTIAYREHKGIYVSCSLYNSFDLCANYDRVCITQDELQQVINELMKTTDEKRRDELRLQMRRIPARYGRGDSLKQILRAGRYFVRSPNPYILQVHLYDNDHDKNYKQGEYLGKQWPQPKEVIAYEWMLLTPRSYTPEQHEDRKTPSEPVAV